jgi:hypothetical protein
MSSHEMMLSNVGLSFSVAKTAIEVVADSIAITVLKCQILKGRFHEKQTKKSYEMFSFCPINLKECLSQQIS